MNSSEYGVKFSEKEVFWESEEVLSEWEEVLWESVEVFSEWEELSEYGEELSE